MKGVVYPENFLSIAQLDHLRTIGPMANLVEFYQQEKNPAPLVWEPIQESAALLSRSWVVSGRWVKLVRFTYQLKSWVQPVYKSTGRGGVSAKGTWLPFSGLILAGGSEWLGKHYWSPKRNQWVSHGKKTDKLPTRLRDVCLWLQEEEERE